MKLLALALVLAKYLVIMVLLAGCGTEEKEDAPATERVEPDLAPVRTFETTPPDEPEPKVAEDLPPAVEPAVVAEVGPSEAELEKERSYIKSVMQTLKVGDTWQSMVPEARALLLEKGDCKGNEVNAYVWCYVKEYKGCEGAGTGQCTDPKESAWHYWFAVSFDPSKTIDKLYKQ